jgi:hypothetical protein
MGAMLLRRILYRIGMTGLLGFALSGCGDTISVLSAATTCQSGSVQIRVGDGFLQPICGCQEGSTAVVIPPATLTCTLPAAGTVVFFHYLATHLPHQLGPVSQPSSFPTSPLSDPASTQPVRSHVVRFDASGTFSYMDLQTPAMRGTVVVP